MMIILSKWNKIYVLALYSIPRFLKFIPILSLLEMEMTSGFSLRRCAFAAISTGVSVIPFTNFAIVLPVHGAMTSASKGAFGRLVLRLELYIFRYFR